MKRIRVGVLGDYNAEYGSHPETNAAIAASSRRLGVDAVYAWVPTEEIGANGPRILDSFDGLWIAPGAPYRNLEGALTGIRHVRENGRPLVGT
jgi:CTP synthase (UTP-ammonia lyase)